MTPDIALTLFILATAVVLLITEWIPMEVTALLALGAVALTGLVSPVDALAGFSNPAVVTIWAVFILSGGLTLTGVANIIGGTGAFVMTASDYQDFATAILEKLVKEISGVPVASLPPAEAASLAAAPR